MISVEFRDWVNSKVLEYLPTQRQIVGDKVLVRCPLCGDSKKNSLKKRGYYYLKTASYHCFNCGENMGGIRLLERLSGDDCNSLRDEYFRMTYDGKHFLQTSSACSVQHKGFSFSDLRNVIRKEWKHELGQKARDYLSNRMVLNAPFLKESLYSYYSKSGNEYILIPWRMNGTECYFQLNDFERHNQNGMKYIFPKNMDKMVYGLDNINMKYDFIIITEGVYDSLFVPNTVAVGGRSVTDMQLEIIRKRYPKMRLCLSFDNDAPGLESTRRSLRDKRYPFSYFKWFSSNTREKDINDFIIANGNPMCLADVNIVKKMILDPLLMKMWLGGRMMR